MNACTRSVSPLWSLRRRGVACPAWQRVAWVLVLWVSALTVQSLGVLHGYVHPHVGLAGLAPAAQDVDGDADAPTAAPAAPQVQGWLQALFAGHHDGSAGCTLFDQLTHADVLHDVPALAHQAIAPALADEVHAAWHLATQAAGFLARAPPARG